MLVIVASPIYVEKAYGNDGSDVPIALPVGIYVPIPRHQGENLTVTRWKRAWTMRQRRLGNISIIERIR